MVSVPDTKKLSSPLLLGSYLAASQLDPPLWHTFVFFAEKRSGRDAMRLRW